MPQDQSKVKVGAAVAALRAAGYAVCRPNAKEKKPTYKGWVRASLEAKDFKDGEQIGIMGGPLSDGGKPGHALVIIDLDNPDAIVNADAFLPTTGMMDGRKSKPRAHRYFLVPLDSIPAWAVSKAPQAAPAAKAKTGHAGPLLAHFKHRETGKGVFDFIGTGGQVVAPPSVHESGETREWTGGELGAPAVVPFTELWSAALALASACSAVCPKRADPPPPAGAPRERSADSDDRVVDRAIKYIAPKPASVTGQDGSGALFDVVRVLYHGFALPADVVRQIVNQHYNPRCVPEWSAREIEHKIEDVERITFSQPRGYIRDKKLDAKETPHVKFPDAGEQKTESNAGHSAQSADSARQWPQPVPLGLAPDVPTLPVDVLSPWLAGFVRAQSTELQVPFDLPALLALGAAAAGIARKVTAAPWPGWDNEPTNLFVMPCLPPGERKSQSFAKVFAPVADLERELREQAEPLVKEAESNLRILAKRVEHLEAKISKAD